MQVRGRVLKVDALWHVTEAEFSTIRGEREPMAMLGSGG
jgi:hypothetical protein